MATLPVNISAAMKGDLKAIKDLSAFLDANANGYKIEGYQSGHFAAIVGKQLSNEELMDLTQKVIDVIERDGWTKNQFYGSDGKVCLIGAANRVTGAEQVNGIANETVAAWSTAVCKHFGWATVPRFNDDLQTTYEMVIEKLMDFLYELKGR